MGCPGGCRCCSWAPSNGLATASLVLGIIGVVLAIIPFLGIMGALVGGIGLILGIFGLLAANKRGVGKGKSIAGLVLGVLPSQSSSQCRLRPSLPLTAL